MLIVRFRGKEEGRTYPEADRYEVVAGCFVLRNADEGWVATIPMEGVAAIETEAGKSGVEWKHAFLFGIQKDLWRLERLIKTAMTEKRKAKTCPK